jgi:hypothetical protein
MWSPAVQAASAASKGSQVGQEQWQLINVPAFAGMFDPDTVKNPEFRCANCMPDFSSKSMLHGKWLASVASAF